MSDLTLDEKTNYAASRAREIAAEKHFFDAAQPFFPLGFSIGYRNPGHWDITGRDTPGKASAWRHAHPQGYTSAEDNDRCRLFRIRGEPGNVVIFDERWNPHKTEKPDLRFRSVTGAMLWIIEELMREPPQKAREA